MTLARRRDDGCVSVRGEAGPGSSPGSWRGIGPPCRAISSPWDDAKIASAWGTESAGTGGRQATASTGIASSPGSGRRRMWNRPRRTAPVERSFKAPPACLVPATPSAFVPIEAYHVLESVFARNVASERAQRCWRNPTFRSLLAGCLSEDVCPIWNRKCQQAMNITYKMREIYFWRHLSNEVALSLIMIFSLLLRYFSL